MTVVTDPGTVGGTVLVQPQAFEMKSEPCPSGRRELFLFALVVLIGILTAAVVVLPALLS